MNYDAAVLGTENQAHPANQIETADNQPADLFDAFNDYKANPCDETENVLLDMLNSNVQKRTLLIRVAHDCRNTYMANQLKKMR